MISTLTRILFGYDTTSPDNKSKNKCDSMKQKSFCTTKETINKMKKSPMEWEKIFANHLSDKEIIQNI